METSIRAKVSPGTLKTVREAVDFIYELTFTDTGHTGSMSGNGTRFRHVAHIMVERGIVKKEKAEKRMSNYRWNPSAPAPTKVLYSSIAQELIDKEREWAKKSAAKARAVQKQEQAKELSVETPTQEESVCRNTLSLFSIQELWDEFKNRGCYILDGKLAQSTITYFE